MVTELIIGLILGFGSGAFWQERRSANDLPLEGVSISDGEKSSVSLSKEDVSSQAAGAAASVQVKTAEVGGILANKAVLVTDQAAGGAVTVGQVVSGDSVWMAVREEQNGGLGNILGVARVAAGTRAAVVVELLRPTVAGKKYFVVFHRDAGDAAFNYREDVLIEGVQEAFSAK